MMITIDSYWVADARPYARHTIGMLPNFTVLHLIAPYCTELHCAAMYSVHCTAPYCNALCCTVMHSTVLNCTVLQCTNYTVTHTTLTARPRASVTTLSWQ